LLNPLRLFGRHSLGCREECDDIGNVLGDDLGTGAEKQHFGDQYMPRTFVLAPGELSMLAHKPSTQQSPAVLASG
jgi:hypothetical protein